MFEGKRFCRACLTLIVVALVAAMVGAFGLASMSATADPAATLNKQKIELKVTDVETGVTGTAYRYMDVNWDGDANQPRTPEYIFENKVADWMNKKNRGGESPFKQYIDGRSGPTSTFRNLSASRTCIFADALLAAIAKNEVSGLEEVSGSEEESSNSSDGNDASIKFHLPMGAYVIKLGNGSSRVYQPILTHVDPEWVDGEGYKLKAKTVKGAASDTDIEAKSKEIVSTKTVVGEGGSDKTKIHSQIGDNLYYMIKTPIPNYPPSAFEKKFGVKDRADLGLDIDTSSIRVWIDGESNLLTAGTDYSMTTLVAEAGKHGNGFEVEFNHGQYGNRLADAGKNGKTLIVKYTGTLNEKASIKNGTENRAQALILKNNYDLKGEYTDVGTRPAVTKVYTYGVKLTKVDAKNEDVKLGGARFTLRKRPSKELLKKKSGHTTEVKVKKKGTDGRYVVSPEGTDTIISGSDGVVQIDGLGATGIYELTETKAPAGGYALPAEPILIDIRDEKSGKDDLIKEPDGIPDNTSVIGGWIVTPDKDNRLTFTLKNKKADFRLPRTGAIGAVVFGVFGVVLVAVSVAVVAVHRRKARR